MKETRNETASDVIITEIQEYFKFICRGAPDPGEAFRREIWSGACMDHEGKGVVRGYGVIHGPVDVLARMAAEVAAKQGGTLHVCLNRGNGKGRKNIDIVEGGVRCLCVDLDRRVEREEIREIVREYGAGMVVKSSPQKFHLYWALRWGSLKLGEWEEFQRGLAGRLGGDTDMAGRAKTIRVPGCPRKTKEGDVWTPRIVYMEAEEGGKVWERQDILERFPWIVSEARLVKERKKQGRAELIGGGMGVGGGADIAQAAEKLGGRNTALYEGVKGWILREAETDRSDEEITEAAWAYGGEIAEKLRAEVGGDHEFGEDEAGRAIESAIRHGLAARESRREKRRKVEEKIDEVLQGVGPGEGPGESRNGHHEEIEGEEGVTVRGEDFAYNVGAERLRINAYTDAACVERVLQRFGGRMVRTGRLIYAFDEVGKVWKAQNRGGSEVVAGLVEQVLMGMVQERDFIRFYGVNARGEFSPEKKRAAEEKFLSNAKVSGTVARVMNSPDLPYGSIADFDADRDLFYAANGVVDLRSGEIRAARAQDKLLHRSMVVYDREAECPYFENLVREIFAANDEPDAMVDLMQQIFGYTISGHTGERKIFVHVGDGSNGKSKIMEVLRLLMGDYSTLLTCNTLSKSTNAVQKEMERVGAKIEGKRVVILDDLDIQTQWNEGFVKSLTGEVIPARRLYEEERDIPNRAKFHLGCNVAPTPQAENMGILRRLCLIPYLRTFKQDPQKEIEIDRKVREELSGIFNWARQGYLRMMSQGRIAYAREVDAEVEMYKEEHFSIENVVKELFEVIPEKESYDLDNWLTVPQMCEGINEALAAHGISTQKWVNEYTVPKLVRKYFGKVRSTRIMIQKKRETRFCLKLA